MVILFHVNFSSACCPGAGHHKGRDVESGFNFCYVGGKQCSCTKPNTRTIWAECELETLEWGMTHIGSLTHHCAVLLAANKNKFHKKRKAAALKDKCRSLKKKRMERERTVARSLQLKKKRATLRMKKKCMYTMLHCTDGDEVKEDGSRATDKAGTQAFRKKNSQSHRTRTDWKPNSVNIVLRKRRNAGKHDFCWFGAHRPKESAIDHGPVVPRPLRRLQKLPICAWSRCNKLVKSARNRMKPMCHLAGCCVKHYRFAVRDRDTIKFQPLWSYVDLGEDKNLTSGKMTASRKSKQNKKPSSSASVSPMGLSKSLPGSLGRFLKKHDVEPTISMSNDSQAWDTFLDTE